MFLYYIEVFDVWCLFFIKQQLQWLDVDCVVDVFQQIVMFLLLVFVGEVDNLCDCFVCVVFGQVFFFQGGDCVEMFVGVMVEQICNRIKMVLQMVVVLIYGVFMLIVKMGCMVGQFVKF